MTREERDKVLEGLMEGESRQLTLIEIIAIMQHAVDGRRSKLANKGGMSVSYHGPLCNAPPSVLLDVERWIERLEVLLKETVPVELAFNDWQKGGVSVYQTEKGVELSKNDFHSGTVFQGTITLDKEHRTALIEALTEGYTPTFTVFETPSVLPEENNEHS